MGSRCFQKKIQTAKQGFVSIGQISEKTWFTGLTVESCLLANAFFLWCSCLIIQFLFSTTLYSELDSIVIQFPILGQSWPLKTYSFIIVGNIFLPSN